MQSTRLRTMAASAMLLVPVLGLAVFAAGAASTSPAGLPALRGNPAQSVTQRTTRPGENSGGKSEVLKLTTFEETSSGTPPRPRR